MKNLLKSIAAITLLFFTTTGIASEPKMNLVLENDSKSLVFEIDSNDKETKILLTDDNSKILFSENIVNVSYVKKFSFKNLELGTYLFYSEESIKICYIYAKRKWQRGKDCKNGRKHFPAYF